MKQVALLLALWPLVGQAIEVERLEVVEEGRNYVVRFDARLAAPPAEIMRVLTDYERYPELDPRILSAHETRLQDGRLGLYTRLRGCLGSVFCTTMDRYEALEEGPDRLIATAAAGKGDLRSGRTETRVVPDALGARVSYRTEFEPKFWMPRWLVRGAMISTLREGTLAMFTAIEARASAPPP